jgi:dTDP-4-dehydrorhamnose 3,5-epimerase
VKRIETPLAGLVVVETPVFRDARGSFQRLQCNDAFAAAGLPAAFVQTNLSTNTQPNILRGMHYQKFPHQEDKLVRCVHGAILDVVIDIRRSSPTFGRHFAIELSAENARALLVPKGFAHGYLTLTADAAVLYHVTTPYTPGAEGGIRWNDPRFAIDWPVDAPLLSDKDAAWPDFDGGEP